MLVRKSLGSFSDHNSTNFVVCQNVNCKSANFQGKSSVSDPYWLGLPQIFFLPKYIFDYEMPSNSKLSQKPLNESILSLHISVRGKFCIVDLQKF
jgi:hypothetical protein